MPHRLVGAGLAATALLLTAGPAAAQTAPPQTTTYYMTCASPNKVQNANAAAGTIPAWSTTKPAASFQSGAGCGFLDGPLTNAATPTNEFDGYFAGPHGGAIAKAEVEAHSLLLSRARAGTTNAVRLRLTVDGSEVYNNGIETITPTASSSGASEVFKFTIKDLKIPAGAADRQIIVTLGTAGQGANAWVGGASEVPTSVTFTAPLPTT